MSSEQRCVTSKSGPLSHGRLRLALSSGPGDRNGNPEAYIGVSSPDSLRSFSSLSDGGSSSPHDVDMECCHVEGSPPLVKSPPERLGNELVQTPGSGCVNAALARWNSNITLVYPGDSRGAVSPEGEESSVSPCPSGENNCSISSGEMVTRRNSFCLQEGDTLTVSLSLLELSTGSSAHVSSALPADPGPVLLSVSSADLCDVFLEDKPAGTDAGRENSSPQPWGMTFIHSDDHDIPSECDELVLPRPPLDVELSSELRDMHQGVFLCEPALSAAYGGASLAPSGEKRSDAGLRPSFGGGSTNDRTFVLRSSDELDSKSPTHTSTPVGGVGNMPLDYLSLAESPCDEPQSHPESPAVQAPAVKRGSATKLSTSKPRSVARLNPGSANRISRAEIKRFSKPDFSSVRPKIMSRPAHSLTMGSHALTKNMPRKQEIPHCNRTSKADRNTPIRNTPSKLVTMANDPSRGVVKDNAGPDWLSATFIQPGDHEMSPAGSPVAPLCLIEEAECRTSLSDFPSAAAGCAPSSEASSEAEHRASNLGGRLPFEWPGNQTFSPSPSESPSAERQAEATPAPGSTAKVDDGEVLLKHWKRPGSASPASSTSNQDKVLVLQRRSRCWSDSSSTTSTSTLHRETRASKSSSASFSSPKRFIHLGPGLDRPASQNCSAAHIKQPGSRKETAERNRKEIKKFSLVTASSKLAVGVTLEAGTVYDGTKSGFGAQPSLNRARAATAPATHPRPPPPAATAPATHPRPPPPAATAPASQAPATHPRPPPPAPRPRQGRDVWSNASGGMGSPKAKRSTKSGSQNSRTSEGPSVGSSLANGITKPPVAVSRPRQTSGQPLAVGSSQPTAPPAASSSRLPYKPQNVSRSIPFKASEHDIVATGNTQVSSGAASSKTTVFKARLLTHPGRSTVPALATGCKTAGSSNQVPSRPGATPLKRSASSRLIRPAAVPLVDKTRHRATPRSQPPPQPPPQPPVLPPARSDGRPNLVPAGGAEIHRPRSEWEDRSLQQLQGLLVASNCRFEAMVVVLQQALKQRDEAMKQRRDLSQELITLQGQLVSSTQSCERLEQEKEEVRGALEGVLQRMQEQHHTEMAQLEERLRDFYQAQWDQIHLTYQDQADQYKALMEEQMAELTSNHEALKLELEANHCQQIECVKQQYEGSLEELRKAHEQELQTLDKTLKETEATLSELTEENTALNQKLKAEEERRRELAERDVKDSHTLYLEQELESLKVVMDIKNKQLHQQEHKLMQMDKLVEKSVKLDECLKKVQQENEDLKARMDRHAALSRQLSTEQAMLQESLHKESKVNKRLSMENEELIWKLHNGDLSSPRKMSPTSPTHHPLGLQSPRSSAVITSPVQSPRSSAVFTSPPVSPR
ncbi:microtubule-associated tumor suppressor 1 homolog A isoform X2 [Esox lucius]|uniref:microtubule-associated tumor suppressor 1 homolog A isoform X2 n=1 Tax=Esox lucius TaxID=8010 RepID=UPI001476FFA0|nr:microtubule-associated tumor suppressor 1 homolog A isoform X2 [Esox lucius]